MKQVEGIPFLSTCHTALKLRSAISRCLVTTTWYPPDEPGQESVLTCKHICHPDSVGILFFHQGSPCNRFVPEK